MWIVILIVSRSMKKTLYHQKYKIKLIMQTELEDGLLPKERESAKEASDEASSIVNMQ